MDCHVFDKWLQASKKKADLWHPCRSKWPTKRKHHSLEDVAAGGGWKDTETLLTCYQHPGAETLLAVMN